jgi:hypothetical protein
MLLLTELGEREGGVYNDAAPLGLAEIVVRVLSSVRSDVFVEIGILGALALTRTLKSLCCSV